MITYVAQQASALLASGGDRGHRVDAEMASGGHLIVQPEVLVRRLTPLECERLQGLPDGFTATSNGRPQADSPRYRQLGNTVAVPVLEWVARRLASIDATHHTATATDVVMSEAGQGGILDEGAAREYRPPVARMLADWMPGLSNLGDIRGHRLDPPLEPVEVLTSVSFRTTRPMREGARCLARRT